MNELDLKKCICEGLSSRQIASKYEKSQGTITYWLNKFALKTSPKSLYETMNWDKWQTQYDSGLSWNEIGGFSNDAVAWAKRNGKIKTRSLSEAGRLAWTSGKQDPSVYQTPEHRKIMSQYGGLKPNSGRCKHIKYTQKDGLVVDLQGSWEEKFVIFLDTQNVMWERNRVGYKYTFNGRTHQYFPDFRLNEYDVYVEVKGYETERDREKWRQFPFDLLVVKKDEIQNLQTWWKTHF